MSNTFRTILQSELSPFQINHQSGVLCIGSCFAEHLFERLDGFKFNTLLNPFGIIFNPISIAQSLDILLDENRLFEEKDLFQHLGGWHSFQHHGSFSNPSEAFVLEKINNALLEARTFLKKAEFLVVTFGTSNVFVSEKTGQVVANCHKVPQKYFIHKKLSSDEIILTLDDIFRKLGETYPQLKIITTVSPVRHIRDGLVANQISKSKLLVALDNLSSLHSHLEYFPSYEIMMDDLRNYRFYKKDLIHPNEMAVDYIWDFFSKTFFTKKTIELNAKLEKINLAKTHRPFHPESEEHSKFKKNQLIKIEELEKGFPFLNFEKEKVFFGKTKN
ncbi:MAG: GSCFA domain-containing protein [Saprospiraceae bacterium]